MRPLFTLFLLLTILSSSLLNAQEDNAYRQTIWGENKIHFTLSSPFINYIYAKPPSGTYEQSGIMGFSLGGNYCNSDRVFKSLQIGVGNVTPTGVRYPDSTDWKYRRAALSFFINLRQNHIWKRIDVGYGPLLSCHILRYESYNRKPNIDRSTKYNNWGLGGSFSVYYRVFSFLYSGMLYQPHFISISHSPAFNIEHFLSFDILLRFDPSRKR